MADWYVSSAAYATYTAFQGSHLYSIGALIVPTAPAAGAKYVFRCTTGGTSTTEPAWSTGNNATSTSGTAVFTNVTGQSTYFWTAAAGDITSISYVAPNRLSVGDRVYISSDHSESTSNQTQGNNFSQVYGVVQFICVNRAGSSPPVAADVTTGATITGTGGLSLYPASDVYYDGITFAATSGNIVLNTYTKSFYVQNGKLYLNHSGASNFVGFSGSVSRLILDNTQVQFGAAGQSLDANNGTGAPQIEWRNTASAIQGTTPTTLFKNSWNMMVEAHGVDLSAITGTLVAGNGSTGSKFLFDSCKIASGVTRYGGSSTNANDLVELINCYDGTNIISESHSPFGDLTTETTITLSGGAVDDVGAYSHKIVTNTNVDKFVNPFCSFWLDVENTTTGSPKTATVEIISSTALNNDEIALYLQYEGTAGSSVASFGNSFIATPLTTPAAVTTSTATWNSSPATPQKQKCQVTFTPQHAGRLRGQIRVGKASCTVYINPQIAVT